MMNQEESPPLINVAKHLHSCDALTNSRDSSYWTSIPNPNGRKSIIGMAAPLPLLTFNGQLQEMLPGKKLLCHS